MSVWMRARRLAGGAILLALSGCAGARQMPPGQPVQLHSVLGSYLAARHAQEAHDYADAAAFLDRALAADPGNDDLIRRTFVLRLTDGRVAEAVPLAHRIVDIEGRSGLAGLVLLEQQIKTGDYDGAIRDAATMPRDGAQRYAVPLLLAWAEVGRGQPAPALQALDAMGDLGALQPLRVLHAALIADFADRIDDAAAGYAKLAAGDNRPTWRVAELAGNFYERHARSAEAGALYAKIAAEEPEGGESDIASSGLARIAKGTVPARLIASAQDGAAEAMFDLAGLMNQRDTVDAALIYARLAIDLEPHFGLAELLVGEIRDQQQRPADALVLYRAVDPASPLYWMARLRMVMALDALGRTDEAAAQLASMAAERPDRAEPLIELGDLLRGHKRFAAAVTAYDGALARTPQIEPRAWRIFYGRGVALERSDQWPRAEADLQHALALQPDQPLILNYLGYSWVDKGENLPAALRMIQRAVELKPDDGYMVDSLGWAYFRLGNFSRATELLERAIELLPEDPTINDHLGDVYWRTGRVAEARFQWRRALQFQPEADEVKGIETKLDRGLGRQPGTLSGG